MSLENEDCVLHFEGKGGPRRKFTDVSFQKFLIRRKEWLLLSRDYKEFTKVARETLDIISPDSNLEDLDEMNKLYHVSCYQMFTNTDKLDRAKRSTEIPLLQTPLLQHNTQENLDEPPAPKRSKRIQLQQELAAKPIDSTEPLPSTSKILPRKCLICKSYNPIYVTDSKVMFSIFKK